MAATPLKKCCTCQRLLPVTEFNKRARAADGLQSRCRECSRLWYEQNKVGHKIKVRERNRRYRRWVCEQIAEYLSTRPCVDCGEDDPRCLEFDHRDRSMKTANVATLVQRSRSWGVILAEIEKCDVRCANCHRRRTAVQFSTWRHRVHEEQDAEFREVVSRRFGALFPTSRRNDDGGVEHSPDAGRA